MKTCGHAAVYLITSRLMPGMMKLTKAGQGGGQTYPTYPIYIPDALVRGGTGRDWMMDSHSLCCKVSTNLELETSPDDLEVIRAPHTEACRGAVPNLKEDIYARPSVWGRLQKEGR